MILLAVAWSSNLSLAQSGLKLGAFAMPTVSTVFNETDNDQLDPGFVTRTPLQGMATGLILGWNPGDNIGVRMNIIYQQSGNQLAIRNIATGTSTCHYNGDEYSCNLITTRLNYLKIPLMLGITTSSYDTKTIFSFYLGAQVGMLVKAAQYDDKLEFTPPVPANVTSWPDTYATYNKWDLAAVADIGFDIHLVDDWVLNLHLRGNYSLKDIENKEAVYRITEGGKTEVKPFWDVNRLESQNVTVGLMIGLTYTFSNWY